jgi:catechol 2,3-dioxygenase-like lactoylglutathione lyase family enzyme
MMLNTSKIIAIVSTKNPDKAREFYERVLGLKFVRDEHFALVFNANDTMLRVTKVQDFSPAGHAVLGWEVADVRAAVAELSQRGVRFERYNGMTQDVSGVWASPSGARVAWFKDPDGNVLSLTQF